MSAADTGKHGVEPHAVDQFRRPADVPQDEVGPFPGFERSHLIDEAECARGFARRAGNAFLDGHAEEGRRGDQGDRLFGVSQEERLRALRHFGVTYQSGALFGSMTLLENVCLPLESFTDLPREARCLVAEMKLELVGLKEYACYFPSDISGGMKKRVGLARAIAADPEIIFFDEPTTGLDPIMADVINNLIVDCVKRLGATTISITHDMASARKIADDIAMIYKGEIVWQGPAKSIDSSTNPYVEQFIHGRAEGPIQMDVLKP